MSGWIRMHCFISTKKNTITRIRAQRAFSLTPRFSVSGNSFNLVNLNSWSIKGCMNSFIPWRKQSFIREYSNKINRNMTSWRGKGGRTSPRYNVDLDGSNLVRRAALLHIVTPSERSKLLHPRFISINIRCRDTCFATFDRIYEVLAGNWFFQVLLGQLSNFFSWFASNFSTQTHHGGISSGKTN